MSEIVTRLLLRLEKKRKDIAEDLVTKVVSYEKYQEMVARADQIRLDALELRAAFKGEEPE